MWQCFARKKTARAVVRLICQQGGNPGPRFMRGRGNVTHEHGLRQAVFIRGHRGRYSLAMASAAVNRL
ncbi:hypothetical protein AIE71_02215 [Salmonella enterica subsp. enterica]|nr:hypothetical protein [Salmonella enterica subsp. enterica serovar Newport]ECC3814743.1 hypothetical protein [Salmonella enterica subsp. enterica]EDT3961264.1 hypothetical protein [Salmonella enterica subsp. enterica serovar Richmond]EEA7992461.1 hypothetical protein [Salmonella enterica subsp. enterica]